MPTMPMLHTYKAGPIEQVSMPGETVGVWVNKVFEFYRVVYVETIPRSHPVSVNLGALAAAGQSNITQVTMCQMPHREFAQLRMEVLDDVEVRVYQGRADQRHKLHNQVATLSRMSREFDSCGHQSEVFEFEDNYIFLQGINNTDYALTVARVAFWGYRYVLETIQLPVGQKPYSWAQGNVPPIWTRIPATAHL